MVTISSVAIARPGTDRLGAGRLGTASLIGLAAVALLLILVTWAGVHFTASDDVIYWAGGQGWLRHFPYVGGLGANRETLAIPVALATRILGDSLVSLDLPSFLYAAGLTIVMVVWANAAGGPIAAGLTGLLLATCPLLVISASVASIDPVECCFDLASLYMLYRAVRWGPSWWTMLSSGALLGFGAITRETTVFLAIIYGLLFVAGYGFRRRWYLVLGVGFALVVGLDTAYYGLMTGNPLYRFTIALHHDNSINRWIEQGAGVPLVHPALDPFTLLALSHYFGLLFWVAVPVAAYMLWTGSGDIAQRRSVQVLAAAACGWFVLASANVTLLPLLPRYFMVCAILACVLAGIGLGNLWSAGRRTLVGLAVVAVLVGNAAGLCVENRDLLFGERKLVTIAETAPAIVHSDAETIFRADLLLNWSGVRAKVSAGPAKPGDLFLWNALRADPALPQPSWTVVERAAPDETVLRAQLGKLLRFVAPGSVRSKLGPGHPGVVLYQVH